MLFDRKGDLNAMHVKIVAWTLILRCTFRNHIFQDAFLL